jgi:hypothetical protein
VLKEGETLVAVFGVLLLFSVVILSLWTEANHRAELLEFCGEQGLTLVEGRPYDYCLNTETLQAFLIVKTPGGLELGEV